jgi:hypothetical protein
MVQDPNQRCAICQGATGAACSTFNVGAFDGLGFRCEACGEYKAARTAWITWLDKDQLTALQRAALSHQIRVADRSVDLPIITTFWIEEFLKNARLPSVAVQASNFLRAIGDHQASKGRGYFVDTATDTSLIGAFDVEMFGRLLDELRDKGLITGIGSETRPNPRGQGTLTGILIGLTLDGWEKYEAERRGKVVGSYGFLAMRFGDTRLDAFAEKTIKPEIKAALGYDVVDLRNVARAGVIDNILREQIRDAAFVLVDLTHDNSGAYWEAGYAEGLGKPVIYLCERSKFDQAATHFDTNHCTTVLWAVNDDERFVPELIATIRRSLALF